MRNTEGADIMLLPCLPHIHYVIMKLVCETSISKSMF